DLLARTRLLRLGRRRRRHFLRKQDAWRKGEHRRQTCHRKQSSRDGHAPARGLLRRFSVSISLEVPPQTEDDADGGTGREKWLDRTSGRAAVRRKRAERFVSRVEDVHGPQRRRPRAPVRLRPRSKDQVGRDLRRDVRLVAAEVLRPHVVESGGERQPLQGLSAGLQPEMMVGGERQLSAGPYGLGAVW